jgi:membrane-bound lytic murein transglycosylase D
MVWLHRIPPLMSALAFGYGVGMATPDSALTDARAAWDAYRVSMSRSGAAPGRHPAPPPPQPLAYGPYAYAYPPPGMPYPVGAPGGDNESRELLQLRAAAAQHGATCRLGPTHSSAPALVGEADDETGEPTWDPDELDPAGKEALSRLQLPDFKVAITKSALRYVRFLTRTERGRDMFESWLKRSGRYAESIQESLREWRLPEDLIWVAMIESGFDPRAVSPAGATGLWQFMKATGDVYGLEVTKWVDLRKNPVTATRAAAHHLRDLYQRFQSWDLAFAAYNMGYEQLLERIDRYGTSDFSELARQRALPEETSAYVPKIVAAALVANNLELYGFADVKLYTPMHTADLAVPGGTSLATIARAAGISTSMLRRYNPHFLRDSVPPGNDVIVMVPADALSRARAALPAMIDERPPIDDADVLAPDDILGLGTGRKHRAWDEGENLLSYLPKPKRRSLREVIRDREGDGDDALAAMAEEFAPRRGDREVVMYRVGPGDTLIGVARQFAIDIEDLARDNALDPEDKLMEGALLKLLVKREVLEQWKKKAGKTEVGSRDADDRKKSG